MSSARHALDHARPLLSALTLALLSLGAQAAGYRFGTQSAAGEGTANANGAEGADASTVFANPAAMTRLKGWNFSGVLDVVEPKVRFTDAGSFISLPGSGLQPRPTSQPGALQGPADTAFVPHVYAAFRASDSLAYGLGMFASAGAKLDYAPNWGGRYNLQSVELKGLVLNPNIAWKATSSLSLAAGLGLQYMKGDLKRAVPYGSAYAAGLLAAAQQAAASGAPALALQLQQQAAAVFGDPQYDGSVRVEGDDWGLGFNLAALWEISPSTRVGVSYRSSIKQRLQGTVDWAQPSTLPAQVLAVIRAAPYSATGALDHNDSGASLAVRTPETLSLHGLHQLTPTVALMADFTWTRYARLEQLRIKFDSTTPDSITAESWKNAWATAVGANWKVRPDLMLRAGVAVDRSPVPSRTRGPALPDAHRLWTALGANLQLAPSTSLDLSLGYLKIKDAAMNITDDGEGELPCNCSYATVRGNYDSKAILFGLQINHKF